MDGNWETLAWGRGCVVLLEQGKMAQHVTRFELLPKNTTRTRGVASFSTSCRPGRLSFTRILQIARMTSRHWPHQHFELLRFLAHPKNAKLFVASGKVIKPKICRPGPSGLWACYAPENRKHTSRWTTSAKYMKKMLAARLNWTCRATGERNRKFPCLLAIDVKTSIGVRSF